MAFKVLSVANSFGNVDLLMNDQNIPSSIKYFVIVL